MLLAGFVLVWAVGGCTQITSCEPQAGPPGQCVYLKSGGMFGDPAEHCVKWDGKVICDPFPGSFTVPDPENGGTPGEHKITIVDKIDASEAFLIFPMLRAREHSVTFTVTEP